MEKKNNKKNLLIVIILIIIIGIIGLGVYMVFIKEDNNKINDNNNSQVDNDNNNENNNTNINYDKITKIDETKDWVYVQDGNEYELYAKGDSNYKVSSSLDYPVININTDSVKKLNDSIKNDYLSLEEDYKNNDKDWCTCIKINDVEKCDIHLLTKKYEIEKTEKYISLIIKNDIVSFCAGGWNNYDKYVVSTETGKVLNNEEIISILGYDKNKVLDEFKKFLNGRGVYTPGEYSEEDDYYKDINDLDIVIRNGKLVILDYPVLDGSNCNSYYDGNKVACYEDEDYFLDIIH